MKLDHLLYERDTCKAILAYRHSLIYLPLEPDSHPRPYTCLVDRLTSHEDCNNIVCRPSTMSEACPRRARIAANFPSSSRMASTTPKATEEFRRRPLQAYNSFPRTDAAPSASEPRARATTIASSSPARNSKPQLKAIDTDNVKPSSATSVSAEDTMDVAHDDRPEEIHEPKTPADFDELPLEIISLCDT